MLHGLGAKLFMCTNMTMDFIALITVTECEEHFMADSGRQLWFLLAWLPTIPPVGSKRVQMYCNYKMTYMTLNVYNSESTNRNTGLSVLNYSLSWKRMLQPIRYLAMMSPIWVSTQWSISQWSGSKGLSMPQTRCFKRRHCPRGEGVWGWRGGLCSHPVC